MDNYLNSYIDNANNFYIHWNKMNIGSRANKKLSVSFQTLREQMEVQLKAQYFSLMSQRMRSPAGTIKAISNSMNLTEEEFMNKLDAKIRKDLQEGLSVSKLESLLNTVKGGDLNSHLRKAIKQDSIQELNEAFVIVGKCLDLLEGKRGNKNSLGVALVKAFEDNPQTFSEVGVKLRHALSQWENNNNFKTIKKQSLDASYNQLQNLATALETGKFKTTGNDLTADGLVTLVSNGLISTSIAEGLAFSMNAKAGNILHDVIAQSVGTKAQVVQNQDGTTQKVTGKTDILLPKVKIQLEGIDQGISLDIGISSKFYTGQAFLGNLDNNTGSFSSGSGGTLKEALSIIFPNNKDRYLAYNYMVHDKYVGQMNDLIAVRQLLRLFSTTGTSKDFAQYMLINGRIISIWQLIQYAITSDLSLSNSLIKNTNSSQGIVLSIPDRPKFKASFETVEKGESILEEAWKRSREQNSAINSARIVAKLHFDKLAQAFSKTT